MASGIRARISSVSCLENENGQKRYGMVWYGMVWYGMVWYGFWRGNVPWCCMVPFKGAIYGQYGGAALVITDKALVVTGKVAVKNKLDEVKNKLDKVLRNSSILPGDKRDIFRFP